MTRQTKTPRQRAQEALDVEERRCKKLAAQRTKAKTELERITREHDAAQARRDYLRKHPDLATRQGGTTGTAATSITTTNTTGGTTA